jgi:hypothetical protein
MHEVSLFYDNHSPIFYIVTENIIPDKKPEWWICKFIALTAQPFRFTLILREEYLYGKEFTIDGVPKMIKPLKDVEIKGESEIRKEFKNEVQEEPKREKLVKKNNVIYPKFGGKKNDSVINNISIDPNNNDDDIA